MRRATGEAAGRPGGGSAARGVTSPGARISAITLPTVTSSPACAVTAASVPSAGASSSTVTLSVSTSIRGSCLRTGSPSARSQRTTLPVSWATPRAGMITSVATLSAG